MENLSLTNRAKNKKKNLRRVMRKEESKYEKQKRLTGLDTSCEEIVIEGNLNGGEDSEENIICYWICLQNRGGIGN